MPLVDDLTGSGLGLSPTAEAGSGVNAASAALSPAVRPALANRIGREPDAAVVAPSLGQAAGNLSDAVVGLIDSLRKLLSSTLPNNPVSEFLSGALYLVRRTLKPVGSGVGLFGKVPCVGTGDCSGRDLTGADLSGRNLTALNLSRAVLSGVDFSGADLSLADLSMTQLRGANLTDANLRDANLFGADLVGADLDGVTNFATATLTGADLSGQILLRLNLSGRDLTGADFSGAILTGTDLSDTELGQVNFAGAKLAGVNLGGADLTGVNLDSADLSDVIWGDTPCPGGVDCAAGGDATAADTGVGAVDTGSTGSVDQGLLGSDPSIATNPNFSYADAILAGEFSELAYKHRGSNFGALVDATGWQGISVEKSDMGPGGFSPSGGGYGVIGTQDGMRVSSYAFAGKRPLEANGQKTMQFVFAVEGSNECGRNCLLGFPGPGEEPQDWDANVRQFGWSRYYASLQPLMAEVLRQMISFQKRGWKTQLIITGHSLGGATAMIAYADLMDGIAGDLYPGSQTNVLAFNKRIWDKVGDWTPATLKAIQDVTTVYTFGAPSPLIDPLKDPGGLTALRERILSFDLINIFKAVRGIGSVREALLPEPFRNQTANRIFQFEHKGATFIRGWKTIRDEASGQFIRVPIIAEYADDVVTTLGSRDPGYVFGITLRPDVQRSYAGGDGEAQGTFGLSAATHSMSLYNESLIRLVTWDALLADSAPVESVVGSRTSGGNGSDGRNDVFREMVSGGTATVTSVQVTSRGSGYDPLNPPSVRLEGGGGTGATAVALVPDHEDESGYYVDYVTEVRVTNPGSGYTSAPNVIIAPPRGAGGDQAVAVATLNSNPGNVGRGGNDWYAPHSRYSYLANGGPGSDLYAIYYRDGIHVTIDGSDQSGTDGVIFHGTPSQRRNHIDVKVTRTGQNLDVTYTSRSDNAQSDSTLQIKNWDRWAPSDVFRTDNFGGRLNLARLPQVYVGPAS